eukprot:CAMPEP_0184288688 /NCGR_PEP_ID=MMETSP1049-20130417/1162_1 /TAXON_ID=77928 /ORGANISM="Proteomonas sulcata, Strain CCMP704" /LENGTH=227 /DNA_ID=CAMNT_0026595187 /DNA_START=23 /DNA_END=706 /DNA_ORIENTATION=+
MSAAPVSYMPQGYSAGFMPQQAYGAAPQGTYYGSSQVEGKVIDRYMVQGEARQIQEPYQVQSFQTVQEQQVTYESKEITVKVPRTVMEDVEVTYQVPAYETRTHTVQKPRTVMEEQMITEQVPRTVMQPRTVTVPQTYTTQMIQMQPKIVEYERPKIVPGRYVRTYDGQAQTVGYQQQPMMQQPMMTTMQQPISYGAPMYGGVISQPTYGTMGSAQPIATADDAISA